MNVYYLIAVLGCCFWETNAQSFSFNFEISLHVRDEIQQLLEIGMRPVRVLFSAFCELRQLDPHDFNGTRRLYHLLKINFPEAQALYTSFEDGSQIAYVANNETYPVLYVEKGANCTNCRMGYDIDADGNPTELVIVQNYNARIRAWYIAAKSAYITRNVTQLWSVPTFFVVNKVPGVVFSMPVLDAEAQFAGTIALNYALTNISNFLAMRYKASTRTVFVVDHPTGYLLGCSEDTPLNVRNNVTGMQDMVFANRSFSSLVSRAMLRLELEPVPDALVIVSGRYIQSTLYEDLQRNIQWRIVVIMPANPTKDFVAWTDPTGIGVECLAIFAICVSLAFMWLVFRHRHAKIVKMSQVSFVNLFLFGCLFLNISIFFLLGENTTTLCALRAWVAPLMLALTIAPLLFKTWWIYVLFSRPFAPRPPTKSVFAKMEARDRIKVLAVSMTARTALLVFVEFVILLIGNLLNPSSPVETTLVGADGFYSSHMYCGPPNKVVSLLNNLFFAGLLLTACILAFKARNINENLAESRSVAVAVYAVSLFALIIQLVRGTQHLLVDADTILSASGLAWGTTVGTFVVLGPRFLKLFTIGDEAACAWLQAGRPQMSSNLSNYTDTAPSSTNLMHRPQGSISGSTF